MKTPVNTSTYKQANVPVDGLSGAQLIWAVLVLSLGVGMSALDTAIANTALPAMADQLHATPANSVWIVNAYQLAMVATLLPVAALGETIGYKRVYIGGMALFTAASLACALAWSLPMLIVGRLFQGLGAAMLMGVNSALIRAVYPARLHGRGFGNNALVVAIGFALGPSLASVILATSSWEWLFGINVIPGILGFFLSRKALPETGRASHKVDGLAGLYNVAAFGMAILALGDAAHRVGMRTLLPEIVIALVFFVLLLRRQKGHPAPLLPVDLFRLPLFTLSTLTAVCTFAAQALAFVALPFYFESQLGRTPVETGFLLTPWPVMVGVMAPVAGRLSDRYSPGLLGGVGLAILAAGLALLLGMPASPSALDIGWRMAVCGIGFGFFQAPNVKAIMASAPPSRSGSASGMVATARLVGQSLGAALVAFCLTMFYLRGTWYAIAIAAVFAAAASIASFSRLMVAEPAHDL
ncbi:multidrug MFS transporter [Massilia sp. WF1]|uniref:MFS transporter n=1 Tax=unclassified Massilia TaxID=2609279 RepID=UPI00064960CE|nr:MULTISPECIES: MFS transporter [unclassified Massilia]ALK98180.1 multidrug MFS transporter [Massilia sp. WG5]KLU37246.1 multidrug MFS transporter [Massilia sp. WF1]